MARKGVFGGIALGAIAFAALTPSFVQAEPPAKDVIVVNDMPIPIELTQPAEPIPVDPGDSFQELYTHVGLDCTDIVAPQGRRLLVQSAYFDASGISEENAPDLSIEIRPPDDPDTPFIDGGPRFGTPTVNDLNVGFWRGSLTNVHLFEDPANGSDLWVCFSGGQADVVVSGRLEG